MLFTGLEEECKSSLENESMIVVLQGTEDHYIRLHMKEVLPTVDPMPSVLPHLDKKQTTNNLYLNFFSTINVTFK